MTEPVTNADVVTAVHERFDCTHVLVGSWTDDGGREWIGVATAADPRPDAGTTWTMLGCGATREALLKHVRTVQL